MRSGTRAFSRLENALRAICVIVALGAVMPARAQNAERAELSERDVVAALEAVRSDPNLSAERKVRTLRWVKDDSPAKQRPKTPGWLQWLGELAVWLARNARFLFWGVLVVLAVMLVAYLVRMAAGWRVPQRSRPIDVPDFVRDLDIRPESLPDDVGAAARHLWETGEHRAALALLYRGLLSRLVHVHGVPIKDSTTEGDCLALANQHLFDESRKSYVSKLVRVWQRAVYGGEQIESERVYELCNEFAQALDDPERQQATGTAAAAGAAP